MARTDDTILVAHSSFAMANGVVVHKGTTVRVGHPMLKGREELFSPLVVDYEVEEQPAPGRHAARATTAKSAVK
jgi:hypothetical protein